jgi:uncharacterized protein (TIGR00255 family)
MTGFGQGAAERAGLRLEVELKGVNHRFLDVKMRLPPELAHAEPGLRAKILAAVARGRVDVVAVLTSAQPPAQRVDVNHALIAEYLKVARTIGREFRLKGSPGISFLLTLPGALVVRAESPAGDGASTFLLEEAFDRALESYSVSSRREGERLALEIGKRLAVIRDEVLSTGARAAGLAPAQAARLRDRLAVLLQDRQALDEVRLAQEVALIAARVDITEEITRLQGHLEQAEAELSAPGAPVGKALDFLMQEMNREANTISSKAEDLVICQSALRIKSEVEKIREQVQNLE